MKDGAGSEGVKSTPFKVVAKRLRTSAFVQTSCRIFDYYIAPANSTSVEFIINKSLLLKYVTKKASKRFDVLTRNWGSDIVIYIPG